MRNPFLFETEEFGSQSSLENSRESYEGENTDFEYEGGFRRRRAAGSPGMRISRGRGSSARPQKVRPRNPPSKRPRPRKRRFPIPYPFPYPSARIDFISAGAPVQESSECIRLAQRLLNRVLGLNLTVDGVMNVETRNAIRSFENQQSPSNGKTADSPTESPSDVNHAAQNDAGQEEYYSSELFDNEFDYFEFEDEDEWNLGSLEAETFGGFTSASIQSLKENAVKFANQEWVRWGKEAIKESDPKIRSVLLDYWKTGTGQTRKEANWWRAIPWSAAFISWIMKKAGAGNAFKYSAAHSGYIKAAKENRLANNNNPFKAYRIKEISPQPGDLVCACRQKCVATYDNIRPGMPTHCDLVTERGRGYIMTIGGNVNNTVGRKRVPLDENGFIKAPKYFAVIRPSLQAPASPSPISVSAAPTAANGSPDIVTVRGIKVARQIAPKVGSLLAAAKADGVKLSGGGYRSKEQQIKLRIAHCGGNNHYNIYEKPSKQCSPPTAPPGRSMHEKGLAIDFTYNGKGIKTRDNPGFIWLSKNAARFGLYNLPSEPWHWSVNGK